MALISVINVDGQRRSKAPVLWSGYYYYLDLA